MIRYRVICVPEDLKTLIARIIAHIEQHVNIAKKAAETEEFDTLDFALAIIASDAVQLRSVIQNKLQFLKQQK